MGYKHSDFSLVAADRAGDLQRREDEPSRCVKDDIQRYVITRHVDRAQHGRLTGMVTEGDLFRRVEIGTEPRHSGRSSQSKSSYDLLSEYLKSRGQRVENIMSPDVIRVFENTPLAEVAALLDLKRIKRVPVVHDGNMVGIVSRADLLRALVRHIETAAV